MISDLTSVDTLSLSLSRTVFEIFDFKLFRVWPWPLTFRSQLKSKFSLFRVWSWPLTFRGPLRSSFFVPLESPHMTSYITFIDTFFLFEIINFKLFRVWPWPLTFRGHLRSNCFIPFESLHMTSYLTSIDTSSLFRTVFEIFDFKLIRVWPWPLTFRDHLRSNFFIPFESPYVTSYLTSIDTFYLIPFLRYSTSNFSGFDLDL